MIQWSQKIPVRDKFSSVLKKKGMLLWACLEPFMMTLRIYSQDFLFISPNQAKGRSLPLKLQGQGMKELLTLPKS